MGGYMDESAVLQPPSELVMDLHVLSDLASASHIRLNCHAFTDNVDVPI